jgi:glycosyltransferase involved in cell wall biosynthesis
LTALVESVDHVCCRYRLAAFRPALERAGHTLELRALPNGWWGRLQLFRRLRGANVILQRRLLPAWQLFLLRQSVRTLIYDFDDAVFCRDSYSPKGLHHARRERRFATTIRACDAVVAGNSFLAEHARRRAPAARVEVIPTCVDPRRYPLAEPSRRERVQLVWVGSSSTLQGLQAVSPLWEAIARGVPGVRLKLICDRFFQPPMLPVIARRWSEPAEPAEIAAADIGISYLPNDLWSRGKCGLKVLQYMAAGLPVVAKPVGVHPDLVWDGETGFLADTPAQWVEAVARLAANPDLRRRLGRRGRELLETRYSVTAWARSWIALLEELEQRHQGGWHDRDHRPRSRRRALAAATRSV